MCGGDASVRHDPPTRSAAGAVSTATAQIRDSELLATLIDAGIRTIFTVPCTVTAGWHDLAQQASDRGLLRLQPTTHEGNLVGLALGHWFGCGELALMHLQNSGLPNAADGVISCAGAEVYDLPLLALVTWRGHDPGDRSEPHQAIGRRTAALVRTVFGEDARIGGDAAGRSDPRQALEAAIAAARSGGRGVLCLSPAAFTATAAAASSPSRPIRPRPAPPSPGPPRLAAAPAPLSRDAAILAILAAHPAAAVLFSNGYTARAARALVDRPAHFYNVGYMGGTLAIGWSLARCRPDLEVVVVDGDQNAQMSAMKEHLQVERPANLHWYVLDNGIGASVGSALSLPLSPLIRSLATVVPTLPDRPGRFPHPRVAPPHELLTPGGGAGLAPLARRFRHWIAARGAQRQPEPTPSDRPSHAPPQ